MNKENSQEISDNKYIFSRAMRVRAAQCMISHIKLENQTDMVYYSRHREFARYTYL